MTSNIEKIIALAPSFIGATIEIDWENGASQLTRYYEKAKVDGFQIEWSMQGVCSIRFLCVDLRCELCFDRTQEFMQLQAESEDDASTEFVFRIDKIGGVWGGGSITQMRVYEMEGKRRLTGPMRVILSAKR
jgi:hypothetical protein